MNKITWVVFITLIAITCIQLPISSAAEIKLKIDTFPMQCSIRAIAAMDEKTAWYAGSNGQYGYTKDGGKTWKIDSLKIDGVDKLEFRSIAVTSQAVFILSVASPALLFKTTDNGESWELVYREDHENVFYDSMTFWDDKTGIAMGDPINECLSIIITRDGGDTWQKLSCDILPPTFPKEAAYAASNTNIAVAGSHAWIASGGGKARVFHTPDKGKSWDVTDSPIIAGGKMTGIYSIAFYDQNNGIIIGGDWDNKSLNSKNKAVTKDGGKSWHLVSDNKAPGYRSCVQYLPNTYGKELFAVGTPGISYSNNAGLTWQNLSRESFYTIRICKSGNFAWLAGDQKIAKMQW